MEGTRESLDDVLVGDRERWQDGPPHELFKRMRAEWTRAVERSKAWATEETR